MPRIVINVGGKRVRTNDAQLDIGRTFGDIAKMVKDAQTCLEKGDTKGARTVMADAHIGFEKLVEKLEDKGNSAESARKIAASIGREKYGEKGMEARSEAGRK